MIENNINITNTKLTEDMKIEKIKLPNYYGNMDEKLTLDEAIEQYDKLILKDTISPKKCIKEYTEFLDLSNISKISKMILDNIENNKNKNIIGILALSPNNVSHLPPTEKDGIMGLTILSNALSNLGSTVVIMTDSINQPILSKVLDNKELFKNYVDIEQDIGYVPKKLNLEKNKIYVIGVVPQPGIDSEWEEFLDNLHNKFDLLISLGRPSRTIDTGIYCNSRGLRINHYCSNLEDIYIKIMDEKRIISIALSDNSNNQLGIYQRNDSRNKYNANHILVSHTIDWTCYYLTAGIALRFVSNLMNIGDNENINIVKEINNKLLLESYQSIFPNEDTFIYLDNKLKELEVWDTLYGDSLKKGFTFENDWEIRMKIRRIAAQYGLPISFTHV